MSVWHFQRFNTGEENIKELPRSGRPELWDIENIRRVLEENPQKVLIGSQKNLVNQNIPYIARLRHLENHTEAVVSVPHELTNQQAERRVNICRQLIDNPKDDRYRKNCHI